MPGADRRRVVEEALRDQGGDRVFRGGSGLDEVLPYRRGEAFSLAA